MSGASFDHESRRARKRRKERERRLQSTVAVAASPELGIRDIFGHGAEDESGTLPPADEYRGARSAAADGAVDVGEDESNAAVPESSQASAPPSESAAAQVAALQDALRAKDELLQALTAQLEEAANRLDRLHRAGADRHPRGADADEGAGVRALDIGQQLNRLCEDWEELRLPDQLAALTTRLDDIYDALRHPAPLRHDSLAADESLRDRPPEAGRERLGSWEDLKAELLREGADHVRNPPADEPRAPAGGSSASELLNDLSLEPPLPVDLESADRGALCAAVEERDVFISHLIRRLCSGPAGHYQAIDWTALAGAPDDLRERLQELEARLQELLRMEECDLSLERARLARERARLEQLRRDVERDTRDDLAHESATSDSDRNERRWLRVFGFGRTSARADNG